MIKSSSQSIGEHEEFRADDERKKTGKLCKAQKRAKIIKINKICFEIRMKNAENCFAFVLRAV